MEETDQELSRFVVNFISIKLKDLSTVVQTLDSARLSKVANFDALDSCILLDVLGISKF